MLERSEISRNAAGRLILFRLLFKRHTGEFSGHPAKKPKGADGNRSANRQYHNNR
jgi:hypothetical protein